MFALLTSNVIRRATFVVCATLGTSWMVHADTSPQTETVDVRQVLGHLEAQINQLGSELQGIQQQAIAANPDLQAQQDAYADLVAAEVKKTGVDGDAIETRLEAIADEVNANDDLNEEKRQELIEEFQLKRQQLMNAQREVLQSPAVQEAGQALSDNLVKDMTVINEDTPDLLAALNQAQAQYQGIMQQLMQHQMGAQ